MQDQVSLGIFEAWLKNTTLVSVKGDTATVVVPNQFTAQWIERRLYQSLVSTFRGIIHQKVDFQFIPAQPSELPQPQASAAAE